MSFENLTEHETTIKCTSSSDQNKLCHENAVTQLI